MRRKGPFRKTDLDNKTKRLRRGEKPHGGVTRRDFLVGLGASAGLLALGGPGRAQSVLSAGLPNPQNSGIEHVVLVMMENRSFDHFLGWVHRANGQQAGLVYYDGTGVPHPTYHLREYQGCAHPDPDHSYTGGRVEYDNGNCDGWLRAGSNDTYCIGYYKRGDLPFLGQAVPSWTTFSSYFAAIMAETYPNRIYQHAAQTDRLSNTNTISQLPTIWDSLQNANLTGRYYYSDVPVLALWGSKYLSISRPIAAFFADCAAGTLPSVAFVDPQFIDESNGTSNDDHPHADIRNGEVFLSQVYEAVTRSSNWANTVLVINFDEWGGFFEHVPPPMAPIPTADLRVGNDGRLGFRVPCLLIAPWAARGYVSGTQFDHTSVLAMIEWRWGLQPLTVRDASVNNLATALNFSDTNTQAPQIVVPPGPYGAPCPIGSPPSFEPWDKLRALATTYGFP